MKSFLFFILLVISLRAFGHQNMSTEWPFFTSDKSEIYVVEYGDKNLEPIVFFAWRLGRRA